MLNFRKVLFPADVFWKISKLLLLLIENYLINVQKEITASKKSYYKEKPEYIENINDIKPGEYVVHTIHGLGVYKGLSKQEIDGQLKDYLTIEYANKDRLHIPAEQINLLCRYRGSGTVKPKLSRMGGKDWESTKAKVKKLSKLLLMTFYDFMPDVKCSKEYNFYLIPTGRLKWKRRLNLSKPLTS